jgi:hypothetical protein
MAADVRFLFSAFMLSALIRVLGRAVPDQRPMPWRKNMTVGDRTMVADRIGGGTLCKKICKTAKGGSMAMTASRNLKCASAVINFPAPWSWICYSTGQHFSFQRVSMSAF